jgi:hypothetical protein
MGKPSRLRVSKKGTLYYSKCRVDGGSMWPIVQKLKLEKINNNNTATSMIGGNFHVWCYLAFVPSPVEECI